jgi:GNAT superfamily N-acetyltransferase
MPATVRVVDPVEWSTDSLRLTRYAFQPSPAELDAGRNLAQGKLYARFSRTHVLYEDDAPRATAMVWRMHQHVRGRLVPMGGIGGVATDPAARRGGRARQLLTAVLADMRDQGQVVSTLYPFRPSFYERFGYAGLAQERRVRIAPAALLPLLRLDLPGEVTLHRHVGVAGEIQRFETELAAAVPGMAVYDDPDGELLANQTAEWAAIARVDGRMTGYLRYSVTEHGGDFDARRFLYRDPVTRSLLLAWVARHTDQVASAVLRLPPGETPETWVPDAEATVEAKVAPMTDAAPMARILSVDGLAGIDAGPGEITVRVDDPLIGGVWSLSGGGTLSVATGGTPSAELTGPGLAALVYGALDPAELPLRGFGSVDEPAAATLRSLFPPTTSHLVAHF